MATCKDCVHVEACNGILNGFDIDIEFFGEQVSVCKNFKDRSRFVELPCKVGDTVYWYILNRLVEDKITNITIYDNVIRVFLKKGISFDGEDIGRTIFLAREEAERALKERAAK